MPLLWRWARAKRNNQSVLMTDTMIGLGSLARGLPGAAGRPTMNAQSAAPGFSPRHFSALART